MARWHRWRPWRRTTPQQSSNPANNTKPTRFKSYAKLTAVGLLVISIFYGVETQVMREKMAFQGVPKHHDLQIDFDLEFEHDWLDRFTNRVFRNEAFMVGYSEKLGNPLWVTYQVLPKPDNPARLPRPDRFKEDWRSTRCWLVLPCIEHDDYSQSGYDRGHLAPNHVIATRYGQNAQHETFLMTNITPQTPDLNRRAWQRLEEISADYLATRYAPFHVVTGPIFDKKPQLLPGYKMIAIPTAFYKIFIREDKQSGLPKVLAFIIPQDVKGNEDLSQFLVSVREIERQTGLDFFHKLDDGVETYIETLIDPQSWEFNQRIAQKSSRY